MCRYVLEFCWVVIMDNKHTCKFLTLNTHVVETSEAAGWGVHDSCSAQDQCNWRVTIIFLLFLINKPHVRRRSTRCGGGLVWFWICEFIVSDMNYIFCQKLWNIFKKCWTRLNLRDVCFYILLSMYTSVNNNCQQWKPQSTTVDTEPRDSQAHTR